VTCSMRDWRCSLTRALAMAPELRSTARLMRVEVNAWSGWAVRWSSTICRNAPEARRVFDPLAATAAGAMLVESARVVSLVVCSVSFAGPAGGGSVAVVLSSAGVSAAVSPVVSGVSVGRSGVWGSEEAVVFSSLTVMLLFAAGADACGAGAVSSVGSWAWLWSGCWPSFRLVVWSAGVVAGYQRSAGRWLPVLLPGLR
jgi:hypothetical protein